MAGEPGGSIPATRAAVEEIWGADLYDFYGISDIFGACAGMCPEKDGLHLAEDHIYMEVIDPLTLDPVADGKPGELVLTTLQKTARPMIRFRTGDIVTRYTEPCACGRTFSRFSVQGRIDDMIIVSGVNLFPSDIEYVVRDIPALTGEYRIVVYEEEHLVRFDVEVEAVQKLEPELNVLEKLVSANIKKRTGVKPRHVKVSPAGFLPRATHKAKRLIDQRSNIRQDIYATNK